jgi:hypothetical protein
VGDNANGANAQSFTILFGKILRLNSDGTIPPNPFDAQTTGKYRAIWAMGLRNPFTFSIRSSGDPGMFVNDVGQVTYEEVNEGLAGAKSPDGGRLGTEKLWEIVQQNAFLGANELADLVMDRISKFQAGAEHFDDETLIVLRVKDGSAGNPAN